MILDIDTSKSVLLFVNKVTEHWFNPEEVYFNLKSKGITNTSDFWSITDYLLDHVTKYLDLTNNEFVTIWNEKCSMNSAKIMGYHCTRHSNKEVFIQKGILPLSNETIKIYEQQSQTIEAKEMWEYRSKRSPGPWFLLSYKDAKNPNNYFCNYGSEILRACSRHQPNVDSASSIPLILHCAISYSLLRDKNYYSFCILRAYFNFIDPEDDLNFEGYSIDLHGTTLEPQYIIRVEEL
jgi:hypothetical protein